MYSAEELKKLADQVRLDTLRAIHKVKSGHPGGCLSAADILTVLYFHTMRIDPDRPKWEDRDRFILSKGHAAPALFAVLARRGYFDLSELDRLRLYDGMLQATPNLHIPGGDMSSGSLGQGLSVGIGMALAGKMDKKDYRVYVMVGDGELEEGQNWEAIMAAPNFRLGNLILILDNNHVQMCGTTNEIMSIASPAEKLRSFGWNVIETDGHDSSSLISVFDSIPKEVDGIPTAVIADTVKGKGVSFMEGKAAWHGGAPDDQQMIQIEKELGGDAV